MNLSILNRRRNGFTLVELLVVITIIGILAAVLLPVLSRAKARTQTTVCQNNLRQLSIAFHAYVDDNNDQIMVNTAAVGAGSRDESCWVAGFMSTENDAVVPALFKPEATNTALFYCEGRLEGTLYGINAAPRYYGSLGTYAKNPKIYRCPADESYSVFNGNKELRARSYSISPAMNCHSISGSGNRFTRTSQIGEPSRMMLFIDEHPDTIGAGVFKPTLIAPYYGTVLEVWGSLPAARHSSGANLSFVDGHVELKKWKDPRTLIPVHRKFETWYEQPNNEDLRWLNRRLFQ